MSGRFAAAFMARTCVKLSPQNGRDILRDRGALVPNGMDDGSCRLEAA